MFSDRISEKLASLSFKSRRSETQESLGTANSSSKASGLQSDKGYAENSGCTDASYSVAPVRVIVRCRPALDPSKPTYSLAVESTDGDKVLKFEAPDGRYRDVGTFRCNAYLGPETAQKDVFDVVRPLVEHAISGRNGTMFFHGFTGSGKTYSMNGPLDMEGNVPDATTSGIAQRTAKWIFERIRARAAAGEVHVVEASFLQISHSGNSEHLIDLLTDDDRKLEVRQDPLNLQSFICDGLRRLPIRAADEMDELLIRGRRRMEFLERSRKIVASRSHCLLMVTVETLSAQAGLSEPMVQRGKLMILDLAGSEALSQEILEIRNGRPATGSRVINSLGALSFSDVGSMQGRSVLAMLLQDSVGDNAKELIITHVAAEMERIDESMETLTFAHRLICGRSPSARGVSAQENSVRDSSVRENPARDTTSRADSTRPDIESSVLTQMRQRHSDCIKTLETLVNDSNNEEREKMKQEMQSLSHRLSTKEASEKHLEDLRKEQSSKLDLIRDEMTSTMGKELEKLRKQSLQDLDGLRQSVEKHVTSVKDAEHKTQMEEYSERISRMSSEIQEALRKQRAAEDEAAMLRVKVASAEERLSMMQDRQDEFRKERAEFEADRKSLRATAEQQWQRLSTVEGELMRFKAEGDVQRNELKRLTTARSEDQEAMRLERENWRQRESELNKEINELSKRHDETLREAMSRTVQAESEHREIVASLRQQKERLDSDLSIRSKELAQAGAVQTKLQAERDAAQMREEAVRNHSSNELRRYAQELEEANAREEELLHMLSEMQDNIIHGTGHLPPTAEGLSALSGH